MKKEAIAMPHEDRTFMPPHMCMQGTVSHECAHSFIFTAFFYIREFM